MQFEVSSGWVVSLRF